MRNMIEIILFFFRDNVMNRDNKGKFLKGHEPNKTSFKKGHCPWNKGLKGIHLSPATEFKKGHKLNILPVGSITRRTDKRGKENNFIKVRQPNRWMELSNFIKGKKPNRWMELSKFIWLKHNKDIPKGYVLHHIDGDELNDSIENLILMTRREHFIVHNIGKLGREKRRNLHNNNIIRLELEKLEATKERLLYEKYKYISP